MEDNSLYLQSGSSITVHCEVSQTIYPTEYIVWYHNDAMLKNGDRKSRVNIRTDRRNMEYSELSITNAKKSDSGEYTCKPASGHPARIAIEVTNGEFVFLRYTW